VVDLRYLESLQPWDHQLVKPLRSPVSQTNEYYKGLRREHDRPASTPKRIAGRDRRNIVTLNNIGWDASKPLHRHHVARPRELVVVASEASIATPEPGTMALFATGLTGFALSAVASGWGLGLNGP